MQDFEPFSQLNGRATAAVSIHDRGLAYGDGLFETMRLQQGQLPFQALHLERLAAGCERLHIPLPRQSLDEQLNDFLRLAREHSVDTGIVKLVVTRGAGGRGYLPPCRPEPNIILSLFPMPIFPEHYYQQGVAVALCDHRLPHNPALAGLKHLNRLDQVLAALEWRDSDCQEGLLLDPDDHLVEAGSRNVFVVKENCLLTPSLRKAGVAGVLRRRIMEDYALRLGASVWQTQLTVKDLREAEEIILCNSVTGVWPVKSLLVPELPAKSIKGNAFSRKLHKVFEDDIRERVKQRVT